MHTSQRQGSLSNYCLEIPLLYNEIVHRRRSWSTRMLRRFYAIEQARDPGTAVSAQKPKLNTCESELNLLGQEMEHDLVHSTLRWHSVLRKAPKSLKCSSQSQSLRSCEIADPHPSTMLSTGDEVLTAFQDFNQSLSLRHTKSHSPTTYKGTVAPSG